MAEKNKVGALSVDEALKSFIEAGCVLDVDGSRKTLIDLNGNPVVEIDSRNNRAVFLDEYHQTAGAIDELQDLIATFDAAKIEVSMD